MLVGEYSRLVPPFNLVTHVELLFDPIAAACVKEAMIVVMSRISDCSDLSHSIVSPKSVGVPVINNLSAVAL